MSRYGLKWPKMAGKGSKLDGPVTFFGNKQYLGSKLRDQGLGVFQLGPAKQGLLVWSGQLVVKRCLLKYDRIPPLLTDTPHDNSTPLPNPSNLAHPFFTYHLLIRQSCTHAISKQFWIEVVIMEIINCQSHRFLALTKQGTYSISKGRGNKNEAT